MVDIDRVNDPCQDYFQLRNLMGNLSEKDKKKQLIAEFFKLKNDSRATDAIGWKS